MQRPTRGFRVNLDGSGFGHLHSFGGGRADGSNPGGSLIDSDGVLYGMTPFGGASDAGTVFKIDPDGSGFTLLHSFAGGASDGASPSGSLIEVGGVLYGTTSQGGDGYDGTIFKVNPDGRGFTLLHSFSGGTSDGASPSGSLIEVGGVLYGMTSDGGASDVGTIFEVNPGGSEFALLHSFTGVEGGYRYFSSSLAAFGEGLYGATSLGDFADAGVLFQLDVAQHKVRRHLTREQPISVPASVEPQR